MDSPYLIERAATHTYILGIFGVLGLVAALIAILNPKMFSGIPKMFGRDEKTRGVVGAILLSLTGLVAVLGSVQWSKIDTREAVHTEQLREEVHALFPNVDERGWVFSWLFSDWHNTSTSVASVECLEDTECLSAFSVVTEGESFWVKLDRDTDTVFLVDEHGEKVPAGGLEALPAKSVVTMIEDQTVLTDVRIVDSDGTKQSQVYKYNVDSLDDQRYFAVGNYNGVFIKTYFAINEDGTVEAIPEASGKSDATAESLRR